MKRLATYEDIDSIIKIIEATQKQFKELGLDQWQNGYPNRFTIKKDIETGHAYVLISDEQVVAYTYCAIEEDPYYHQIDGSWLNNEAYAVVHRFVVDTYQRKQGYAKQLFEYCEDVVVKQGCHNIRIDTHQDNEAMVHFIERLGFTYCGVVEVSDGPRLAFQKII